MDEPTPVGRPYLRSAAKILSYGAGSRPRRNQAQEQEAAPHERLREERRMPLRKRPQGFPSVNIPVVLKRPKTSITAHKKFIENVFPRKWQAVVHSTSGCLQVRIRKCTELEKLLLLRVPRISNLRVDGNNSLEIQRATLASNMQNKLELVQRQQDKLCEQRAAEKEKILEERGVIACCNTCHQRILKKQRRFLQEERPMRGSTGSRSLSFL